MKREEIFVKVQAMLIDALNVGEDKITPTAILSGDLGAESIDYMDIVFRLEREFGIKISRCELFPESLFMEDGDPLFVENATLTKNGLQELQIKMSWVDLCEFSKNPRISKIEDLYTVDYVVNYVNEKLNRV